MVKVDRRVIKTRESINKAFIKLLSEKSFESITINDIANSADINRGTLYLHFNDKYDLMEKVIENHLKGLTDSCTLKKNSKTITYNENPLMPILEYFEENYLFYYTMLNNGYGQCFRKKLIQVITNGMNEMYVEGINPKADKEISTQFIANAIVGTIEWWIKNKMHISSIKLSEDMWYLLENSM